MEGTILRCPLEDIRRPWHLHFVPQPLRANPPPLRASDMPLGRRVVFVNSARYASRFIASLPPSYVRWRLAWWRRSPVSIRVRWEVHHQCLLSRTRSREPPSLDRTNDIRHYDIEWFVENIILEGYNTRCALVELRSDQLIEVGRNRTGIMTSRPASKRLADHLQQQWPCKIKIILDIELLCSRGLVSG